MKQLSFIQQLENSLNLHAQRTPLKFSPVKITLSLLTLMSVVCPARVSLSADWICWWYHLQCPAAGCFLRLKTPFDDSLSLLFSGYSLLSFLWVSFFCSTSLPLWFCSSSFSPKLHSFLAAFIFSFFLSFFLIEFEWKWRKHLLREQVTWKGFYFAIGLTLWLSDTPLYSTQANENHDFLYSGLLALIDMIQSFFLPSLQTEYFPKNTPMEALH